MGPPQPTLGLGGRRWGTGQQDRGLGPLGSWEGGRRGTYVAFWLVSPGKGVLFEGIGTGCEEEGRAGRSGQALARPGLGKGLAFVPGASEAARGRPGVRLTTAEPHSAQAAAAGSLHAVVLKKRVSPKHARRKLLHTAAAGR